MNKQAIDRAIDQASHSYRLQQNRIEITEFLTWLGPLEGKTVLDIGTYHGGTAALFALLGAQTVITVDCPRPDGWDYGLTSYESNLRDKKLLRAFPGQVIPVRGVSQERTTIDDVINILQEDPVDLLFIDGSHYLEHVTADYENYEPLVGDGGVVAFHDIADIPLARKHKVGVIEFWRGLDHGDKVEFVNLPKGPGIGALRVPA